MPRWVLTRRDGLLACEKSDGKTPLVTPIDRVPLVWVYAEGAEDNGMGPHLQAAWVTELELGKFGNCHIDRSVNRIHYGN